MKPGLATWLLPLALLACERADPDVLRPDGARGFPRADRPVSAIISNEFSTEDQRDNLGEAQVVMDLAAIKADTTVADIGAGEGYYTVRLAERVGKNGRVLAQDIDGETLQRLGVRRERLISIDKNLEVYYYIN